MKINALVIFLILLLVLSNGYWMYTIFDSGVTQTYHEQVSYEFANSILAQSELTNYMLKGMQKDSLRNLMVNVFGKENVYEKDDGIHSAWISLGYDKNGDFQEVIVNENVKGWAGKGKAKQKTRPEETAIW